MIKMFVLGARLRAANMVHAIKYLVKYSEVGKEPSCA